MLADSMSGEAPSWFTDSVFSLCPHVEEGLGALWGLCYEGTDPVHGGPTLMTSSPSILPPTTIPWGLGIHIWILVGGTQTLSLQ